MLLTRERIKNNDKAMKNQGIAGSVYGLGFIGALVYYLQHAHSFWIGVLGILKALVWPALLIYHLFTLFHL